MNRDQNMINVVFPESVMKYVELQANNDFIIYENPPYVSVVNDFLQGLAPRYCLELAAGIGRMSVYFFKRFGWQDTLFYLQDGDSGTNQYGGVGCATLMTRNIITHSRPRTTFARQMG